MLFLSRHGGSSDAAFTLTKFLLLFHTQLPHLERIEASRIAVYEMGLSLLVLEKTRWFTLVPGPI